PATPPATPATRMAAWVIGGGGGASLRASFESCVGGVCGSSAALRRASLSLLHETRASEMNSIAERMSTTLSSVERTGITFGFLRMSPPYRRLGHGDVTKGNCF